MMEGGCDDSDTPENTQLKRIPGTWGMSFDEIVGLTADFSVFFVNIRGADTENGCGDSETGRI